ncbi:MAG: NAD(P)/FAD-dependent oxidoreductase, partial [Ilumatobacteraceae bacterium]
MTNRVVIVGAGECGARVALALRERGWDGTITLIGDETDLPYERPPLSKQALTDEIEPPPATICADERFAERGIEVVLGVVAESIDRDARQVRLGDGRRLGYEHLVLATGARARTLDAIEGGEMAMTLRTRAHASCLRRALTPGARLIVVGGGFIGLEVASSARLRGCDVTVVEVAEQVMSRVVPGELAAIMAARHVAEGVELRCGVGVAAVAPDGARTSVHLGDGSAIVGDVVVAGVGAVPNTELAAGAGLVVDNGIAVDEHLQTSDPAIFAAGDCCSFPHPLYGGRRIRLEAWRNAHDHADHVAARLTGGDEPYQVVPWFWSDQYDLGLQIAGLPDAATSTIVRVRADGTELRLGLDQRRRLVAAAGVAPGTRIAKDIRLAEMLIARRAAPDPAALADPSVNLKSLLTAGAREPTYVVTN